MTHPIHLFYVLPDDEFQTLDRLIESLPEVRSRQLVLTPFEVERAGRPGHGLHVEVFNGEASAELEAACRNAGLSLMAPLA